jgi:hypothetical protein
MVGGLHILIWNRTKKPFAVASSGARRGLSGREGEGDLPNVQYKPIWNCHYESPSVQQTYPNKNVQSACKLNAWVIVSYQWAQTIQIWMSLCILHKSNVLLTRIYISWSLNIVILS